MKRIAPFLCLILAALTRFSPLALAQGGPPFRSDDPDTPGNGNWEINTVFMGEARTLPAKEGAPVMVASVAVLAGLALASGIFVSWPAQVALSAVHQMLGIVK